MNNYKTCSYFSRFYNYSPLPLFSSKALLSMASSMDSPKLDFSVSTELYFYPNNLSQKPFSFFGVKSSSARKEYFLEFLGAK